MAERESELTPSHVLLPPLHDLQAFGDLIWHWLAQQPLFRLASN